MCFKTDILTKNNFLINQIKIKNFIIKYYKIFKNKFRFIIIYVIIIQSSSLLTISIEES